MTRLIIHWEGRDWELDFSDLTMRQAEVIEDTTGMPVGEWLGLFSEDFDSNHPQFLKLIRVAYWLMLDQNGDPTPIGAVDFKIGAFSRAFSQAAATADRGTPAHARPVPGPVDIPPVTAPATRSPGPSTPRLQAVNGPSASSQAPRG